MSAARLVLALMLGSLAQAATAAGDMAWVSDRLQAGLHEERSGTSTVLALLPSGAEVEVLERDGAFVFVRSASGSEGWMDAQYLSEQKPAALLLADAEAASAEAAAALETANGRIAELEVELADAKQAVADTAAETAVPPVQSASFEAPVNSETLRELQTLAEENRGLKQRLAESEAAAAMALERLQAAAEEPHADTLAPPPVLAAGYDHYLLALRDWSYWQWLILGSTMLLFFALGVWSVDTGVRRRHGGFRLRV